MKEAKNEEATGQATVWPPPPTDQVKNVAADTARRYLTNYAWLDSVVGIGIGLSFYWFAVYAITNYVLYYLIPHTVDFFWSVVAACIIVLLGLLLAWSKLRLFYRRVAYTILITGAIEGMIIMYIFHLGT